MWALEVVGPLVEPTVAAIGLEGVSAARPVVGASAAAAAAAGCAELPAAAAEAIGAPAAAAIGSWLEALA